MDNSHSNESLSPHRAKNLQGVLVLRHLPLRPNYQHLSLKTSPSPNYPTQTGLWCKTGRTILVSNIFSGLPTSSEVWCHHQVFNPIPNPGLNWSISSNGLKCDDILQPGDQKHLQQRWIKVKPILSPQHKLLNDLKWRYICGHLHLIIGTSYRTSPPGNTGPLPPPQILTCYKECSNK